MNHEFRERPGIDFEALWSHDVQLVEPANRRGRGTSSVGIVDAADWPELVARGRHYVKRQQAFFCRPSWNLFRRTPTLRRELRFISRAKMLGVSVPSVVRYEEGSGDRAVLVLEEINGVTDLERALADATDRDRSVVLNNVGAALSKLHSARILHGAVYPKHVLVETEEPRRVWLIDFEKARRVASRSRAAERDIARLLRHAPFLTDGDLRTLVNAYDTRLFPRRLDRLEVGSGKARTRSPTGMAN